MDRPLSDGGRAGQNSEAAFSKKLKITILMLSLVLMILLLPFASEYGLPILQPMGASLVQRLWDAMRFIAMTAAVSIGIISTSNTHNHDQESDGSSNRRSSSSLHRPSRASVASTSREDSSPHVGNTNDSIRSDDSSSQHASNLSIGKDESASYQGNGNRNVNSQKIKGKEVMNDPGAHEDRPSKFMGSRLQTFEGEDPESIDRFPLKSITDNLSKLGFDSAPKEELTLSTGYGLLSSAPVSVKNITSRADLEKKSVAGTENELRNRNNKNQITMMDDDNSYLRMRNNRIGRGADEYFGEKGKKHQESSSVDWRSHKFVYDQQNPESRMHKNAMSPHADVFYDEKGGKHRRSSSVDRRNPKYIYDQESPDQPGLKQILREMSRERQSKFEKSDAHTSQNVTYEPNERFSQQMRVPVLTDYKSRDVASTSSRSRPLQANVHHHAPVLGSKNMSSMASFQSEADASEKGSSWTDQGKHVIAPETSLISSHKQANDIPSFKTDARQVNRAEHVKMVSMQKQVDMGKYASITQKVGGKGDAEIDQLNSSHTRGDQMVASNEMLTARKTKRALETQSDSKLTFEGKNMQRPHAYGYGDGSMMQLHKDNEIRLRRQSSQRSHSEMDLGLLGQTDPGREKAIPLRRSSSRDRKSHSCDSGDRFDPNWFPALEPPPPPHFLGTSIEGRQQFHPSLSNAEVKDILMRSYMESLVPWRSPAPIDLFSFQRSVSPLEALSLSQGTYLSREELKQKSDQLISNFNTELFKQRQESLERQRRGGK